MKISPSAYQIAFHDLHNIFTEGNGHTFFMNPLYGSGAVQTFDLEQGIQARLWHCSFLQGVELFCHGEEGNKEPYFTIAYFLNKESLQFANNETLFQENVIWDILFITSNSGLRMFIPPAARLVCLNISFSKKWLHNHVLERSNAYSQLGETVFASTKLSLLEYMTASEKKLLLDIIDAATEKSNRSFYIKSMLLTMTSDFFNKIKGKATFCNNNMNALLTEAEKLLCSHITGSMPNFKCLAGRYGVSEVNLKRHFKQRHGINMSTYFFYKKMEYANQLMLEENINAIDAAHQLGYTNVNHFLTMYKRFARTLPINADVAATTTLTA